MLTFYRYKVDKGMMLLSAVPDPYQIQMRNEGYTDGTEGDSE